MFQFAPPLTPDVIKELPRLPILPINKKISIDTPVMTLGFSGVRIPLFHYCQIARPVLARHLHKRDKFQFTSRKQFLLITETFLWYTVNEKFPLNQRKIR